MQGNEREAIITVWKRFAMQIDCVDLGTRNGDQFIRVIASERTKRIMGSKQPIIPRSRCPHRGGLRWLATRTQSRLCGGLLEEFLMCSARKSRAVAFCQRSFGASLKPFECAQRIANRLRARVEIGNRLRTDQPGMPLSISALVENFFTNINSR